MWLVVLVLDHAGPRMMLMLRMVGWRWQALRRVGVMLEDAPESAENLLCARSRQQQQALAVKGWANK